jgi:hypothetical protein
LVSGVPDIVANMARGWNRNPAGVGLGSEHSGVSAALWTHDTNDVQEVTAKPDRERHVLALNFSTVEGTMKLYGQPIAPRTTLVLGQFT